MAVPPPADWDRGGRITLSTGETVTLPLSTEATVYGGVFSAARTAVDARLPPGLKPVPVTPRRAAVAITAVEYHRIGDDVMEPYDEVGVAFPAVETSDRAWPYASVRAHGVSGYVWYLPVTTESAKALGVDVWGYPKVVADISHEDGGASRRTTLSVDGDHVLTLSVEKPPTLDYAMTGSSYTQKEGELLREPLWIDGEIGGWPYSDRVSLVLGDHPKADALDALNPGSRALLRMYADGEFVIGPGQRVSGDDRVRTL